MVSPKDFFAIRWTTHLEIASLIRLQLAATEVHTTAADVLVEALIDWGVRSFLRLPGDGINGIKESLRTRQERIRFVQRRHE